MVINKTKNYEIFKVLKGNRPISEKNVKDVEKAVGEKDMLRYQPILVNEKMQIIDGQHRLETAIKLNKPVYYIKGSNLGLMDVQMLNTVSRRWTLSDYLDSFCSLGNEHYIYIREFVEQHCLPITTCIALLSGFGDGGHLSKYFKDGKFKAIKKKKAAEMAQLINKITEDRTHYRSKSFVLALGEVIQCKPNIKRLKDCLKKGVGKFADKEQYIEAIQKAYNYNLSKANRMIFVQY